MIETNKERHMSDESKVSEEVLACRKWRDEFRLTKDGRICVDDPKDPLAASTKYFFETFEKQNRQEISPALPRQNIDTYLPNLELQ